MNWEEMILKRRDKEAMKPSLCNVRIPFHLYQIAIGEAMSRLPQPERQAVRLRYLKDYSIAGVANYMGVSWDAADSLIERGLTGIRSYLRGSKYEYKGPVKEEPENHVLNERSRQEIDDSIYCEAK